MEISNITKGDGSQRQFTVPQERVEVGSGEFPKCVHRQKLGERQGSFLVRRRAHDKAQRY